MARPKANAARSLIEKQPDAFAMEFSSLDAECAFGVNRGFINRLVKDGIITPSVAGGGAGISRRFTLWNMIEINLASDLDRYFKYFTATQIVQQIASWFRMNFFQYVQIDTVYNYLYATEKRRPFQVQADDVRQTHPAIFAVNLHEGADGNLYPSVVPFSIDFTKAEGTKQQFREGVTHVINMHAIATSTLTKLIRYDESRENE